MQAPISIPSSDDDARVADVCNIEVMASQDSNDARCPAHFTLVIEVWKGGREGGGGVVSR